MNINEAPIFALFRAFLFVLLSEAAKRKFGPRLKRDKV